MRDRQPPAADRNRRRINTQIRVPEVRLIGVDGEQLGVVSIAAARAAAEVAELDLVEVAPDASPPVCRILNYGKWRYEQTQREHEARRKSKNLAVKEMQLRPRTGDHDLEIKARKVREMLEGGHRVKIVVRSRGRELAHPETARDVLNRFVAAVNGVGQLEGSIKPEGRNIQALLIPIKH